jgi:hypothetical protein
VTWGRFHEGCVLDRVHWRAAVLGRWDTRLAKRLDLYGRVCDRRPRADAVVGVARSRIAQRAHGRTVPEGTSVLGQGVHGIYHRRLVWLARSITAWSGGVDRFSGDAIVTVQRNNEIVTDYKLTCKGANPLF